MKKIKMNFDFHNTPYYIMAYISIDINAAYYIRISLKHQKYLKFIYKERFYQLTCLPNGLYSGQQKFTNLKKPYKYLKENYPYLQSVS